MEDRGGSRLEPDDRGWRLEVSVDEGLVDAAVARRLAELRPRAEAPGFRRGKAPLPVLQRVYGPRLKKRQWERQAQTEVRRELAERGLRPVAAPRLEPAGKGKVAAFFELFPELPPLGFESLRLERPQVSIGDSDLDYMMERLGDPAAGRDELRRVMEEELPDAVAEELALAVEAALLAAHPEPPLPASLLEAQIAALHLEDPAKGLEEIEAAARRQLAASLLLAEAARQLGVRSDPAELWQETEKLAAASRDPQEELDRIWGDGALVQEIEEALLRRKVVAAIAEKARVEAVPATFEELARRRRARSPGIRAL